MEDRLLKLLDSEQLSSSRFADVIGVQRSSVSHIISGRNKPSFDFIQKTLNAFPMLNADWLLLGKGGMYRGEGGAGGGTLFGPGAGRSSGGQASQEPVGAGASADDPVSTDNADGSGGHPEILTPGELNIDSASGHRAEKNAPEGIKTEGTIPDSGTKSKQVSRIVILYADNSFDTYHPA